MADEDDYEDFVLEVKCLDTGKTEQVDAKTGGLAGISWAERQRIRGSIVLGEKLLQEKISQFKAQVASKKSKVKSSMKRRTTWGGNKKGKSVVDSNVGELPGRSKGTVGQGTAQKEKSEMTFKLGTQPYHPDDLHIQQKK